MITRLAPCWKWIRRSGLGFTLGYSGPGATYGMTAVATAAISTLLTIPKKTLAVKCCAIVVPAGYVTNGGGGNGAGNGPNVGGPGTVAEPSAAVGSPCVPDFGWANDASYTLTVRFVRRLVNVAASIGAAGT